MCGARISLHRARPKWKVCCYAAMSLFLRVRSSWPLSTCPRRRYTKLWCDWMRSGSHEAVELIVESPVAKNYEPNVVKNSLSVYVLPANRSCYHAVSVSTLTVLLPGTRFPMHAARAQSTRARRVKVKCLYSASDESGTVSCLQWIN